MSEELFSAEDMESLGGTKLAAEGGSGKGAVVMEDLNKVLNLLQTSISSVMSTITNKSVQVKFSGLAEANPQTIKSDFGRDNIVLTASFDEGVRGTLGFVLTQKDVALFADLMMMGDGSAAFDEEQLEVITELMNQVVGASFTTLTSSTGVTIAAKPVTTERFNPDNYTIDLRQATSAIFEFSIADLRSGKGLVLFSTETALGLSQLAKNIKMTNGSKGTAKRSEKNEDLSIDFSDIAAGSKGAPGEATVPAAQLTSFLQGSERGKGKSENIDLLLDVTLNVAIELGRTRMSIKRILELGPGSIIELDKMAGEPVDLLVNDKVIARGEVVVVDENFGIRIISLVSPEERLKNLR